MLSNHVDQVTILERDRLPDSPISRRGVPQGRHAHVLLGAGQALLHDWFPGLREELIDRGAVAVDSYDVVWHQAGAHRVRTGGSTAMSMSRPLLEGAVRRRLLAQRRNVTLADGISVDRPLVEDDRVVGVLVQGTEYRAGLVVDCSGRHTKSFVQLAEAGYRSPEVSAIQIDMAYGTRVVPHRTGDIDGALAVVVDDPRRGHRMGTMVPVEDNRWIITVGGFHGDTPPADPIEFERYVRGLPSPEIADVLDRSGSGPVMTHRMPTSQRRHVERLDRTAPGFLVLGDAICSFNPIYGQGMSSAAVQANALDTVLRRFGPADPKLTRSFYRRAAKVVDVPWKIAAGADFADPRTTGPKPAGTDAANRYLEKMFLACHTSVTVNRQVLRVQNLLARPESLLRPTMIARVLIAARRSPTRIETHPEREASRHSREPDATIVAVHAPEPTAAANLPATTPDENELVLR